MNASLYTPIRVKQKNSIVKTESPPGKAIKEVAHNLRKFLIDSQSDDFSESSHLLLEEEEKVTTDEKFINTLTLCRCYKDFIVLAIENFSEEYMFIKKWSRPKYNLFTQKSWNSSS